jgi:cytochrome c5
MRQENLVWGAALCAAVALLAAVPAHAASSAAPTLVLHPIPSVDLPFGDDVTFPAGPGADVISQNCLTCHSADHTLNQPSLSKAEWRKVVDKMIKGYKAPISEADAATIVDYLYRIKGESASAETAPHP